MVAVGADDTSSMVTFRITDVYPKIQSNVGPLEPHTVDVLMSLTAQAQMAESQLRSLGHNHIILYLSCILFFSMH